MTKSNTQRRQIKNYYRVREALYHHFPKEAIVDYPLEHTIYLSAIHFFKEEGQTVLIYYAQDRLLYPHHLDYVIIPQLHYEYKGIASMTKDNKPITTYKEYMANLSPTPKEIEDLCGFISNEIKRLKEYIKLKKIKDDF